MKQIRTHTFSGVKYNVDVDTPFFGICDRPGKPGETDYPSIRLPGGLPYNDDRGARNGLITLIHECLHAEDFYKTEDKVEMVSEEIGKLLWRLNYRRQK